MMLTEQGLCNCRRNAQCHAIFRLNTCRPTFISWINCVFFYTIQIFTTSLQSRQYAEYITREIYKPAEMFSYMKKCTKQIGCTARSFPIETISCNEEMNGISTSLRSGSNQFDVFEYKTQDSLFSLERYVVCALWT